MCEARHFHWTLTETCQYSRNLAARPDLSLAIFDLTVPPHHGRCVYSLGTAEALALWPGAPAAS